MVTLNIDQFFLDKRTADATFVFKNDDGTSESIPAHKIVLSGGSSVFQAMFYGSLAEEGDIEIVDASLDGFKEFLRWFYSSKKEFTFENADEVLYLATKYDVTKCFEACTVLLERSIDQENVWPTYELALKHTLRNTIKKCEKTISSSVGKSFSSKHFLECTQAVLKKAMGISLLNAKTKFDACMKWSQNAAMQKNLDPNDMEKRRELLGDCIGLIDFTEISTQDLLGCLNQSFGLFSKDETHALLIDISKHLIAKINEKENTKCSKCQRSEKYDSDDEYREYY